MFEVEKEIRDELRATLVTNATAEAGTTDTNVKITAHGLKNGDNVINVTRGNAKRAVTVVDVDNFTVDSVTGQTSGDSFQFLAFKHYYVGQVDEFPTTYLPCVVVFGTTTTLGAKSTATDRWTFDLNIEVYTNAWANVSENELPDDILAAQQQLKDLMEKRQSNGAPMANTILGVVRKYILGTKYLYNDNIVITYGKHLINDKPYFKASMKLQGISHASPRT